MVWTEPEPGTQPEPGTEPDLRVEPEAVTVPGPGRGPTLTRDRAELLQRMAAPYRFGLPDLA